jgi:ubiquinone/menaquinone biosynthesis C-methylase UbiE
MSEFVSEWDKAYALKSSRHKNKYPSEQVVSWVFNNYRKTDSTIINALDLGCGWGNNLRFLLENGYDAVGIEQSIVACQSLKKEFGQHVINGSMLQLPFHDNAYDFIIDRNSIQHNNKADIYLVLIECMRVLKNGGKIYSCMTKDGKNEFTCNTTTENEINDFFTGFMEVKIDLHVCTFGNQSDSNSNYLIEGTKSS